MKILFWLLFIPSLTACSGFSSEEETLIANPAQFELGPSCIENANGQNSCFVWSSRLGRWVELH